MCWDWHSGPGAQDPVVLPPGPLLKWPSAELRCRRLTGNRAWVDEGLPQLSLPGLSPTPASNGCSKGAYPRSWFFLSEIFSWLASLNLPKFRFSPKFSSTGPLTIHLNNGHLLLTLTATARHTVVKAHTKKGEMNHQRPNRANVTGADTDKLKKKKKSHPPFHFIDIFFLLYTNWFCCCFIFCCESPLWHSATKSESLTVLVEESLGKLMLRFRFRQLSWTVSQFND